MSKVHKNAGSILRITYNLREFLRNLINYHISFSNP